MAAYAIQFRRGTTTQHNSFTGLLGEVTVDTDKKTLVVHDGATVGGFPLAREGAASTASSGTFTSNVAIGGTLSVTSTSTFNDDVTIIGDLGMTGHIIPSANITYDLGSTTHMWRDAYIGPGSLYINGSKVLEDSSGTIRMSADTNQNIKVETLGTGALQLVGANGIQVQGSLNSISGDIQIGDHIDMNGSLIKQVATPTSSGDAANKSYVDAQIVSEITGGTRAVSGTTGTFSSNVTIGGNLTINGTTTTVNTQTLSVADNIVDLNSDFTSGTPTENAGIRVLRGDEVAVQIRWNETLNQWQFTNNGSNYYAMPTSTSDLAEGTNLYWTSARGDANFATNLAASDTGDLAEGTNLYWTSARGDANFATNLAASTTDDVTEGSTNLYYTDARVGSYLTTNSYATEAYVTSAVAGKDQLSELTGSTDDVAEGSTNLYFTNTRARNAISVSGDLSYDASTGVISTQGLASSDTGDLAEGTNLYFTDTRARAAISVSGDLGYNSTTGVLSFTERTDAEVRGLISVSGDLSYNNGTGVLSVTTYKTSNFDTDFGNKSTDNLGEGSTNLYYTDARVISALASGSVTSIDTGNFSVSSSGATFDVDMTFNNGTTNVFNIDASTGDTTIGGTTVITGGTTINNTLAVSNDVTFSGDNLFTIENSSSTSVFAIDVTNNSTTIATALNVNNNIAITEGDLSITNSSSTNVFDVDVTANTFDVSMDVTLNNATTINNNLAINNASSTNVFDVDVTASTFNVALDATFNNTVNVANDFSITNSSSSTVVDIDVTANTYAIDMDLTVNNSATFNNNLTINNSSSTAMFDIDVTNATAVFNTDLTVNNNLTINNSSSTAIFDIDVANTTVDIDASLTVSNNVTFDNDITFNIDNSSSVTVFTVDGSTGNMSVSGTSTLSGDVTAAGNLDVTGNVTVGGTLNSDDITAATMTASGNVVIQGNLTVQGTTVTIDTQTIELQDNIILLNSNATGSATMNGGIEIERGDDINVQFVWDETNDRWTFASRDVYTTGTVSAGAVSATTVTANLVGDVTGDVTGNLVGTVTGTVSSLVNHDTDDLAEGSFNLYYTDERVDDRVASLLVAGNGIEVSYDDALNLLTLSAETAWLDNRYMTPDEDEYVNGVSFATTTGILTLNRRLGTDLTVDLDGRYLLVDDYVDNDTYLSTHAFNASTGVLTSTLNDASTVTVDLDGRYLLISDYVDNDTYLSSLGFDTATGILTATMSDSSEITVDLDGRYVESVSAGAGLSNSGTTAAVTLDVNVDRGLTIVSDNVGIADTGVTAGSYGAADSVTTFTVNSRGQLTAANNTSISIVASQVSDFDTAVKSALAMTHSDVYVISAAGASANAGANPELSWATLGFNLTGKDMYMVYMNRMLLRPEEYTVSSTGITFDQFLLAEDDEIEAVMLG